MTSEAAYVDLQVNGYAGVDFNSDGLTVAQLKQACEQLQNDGVAGILATIITDKLEAMEARLRCLAAACEKDDLIRRLILGIHIEGPFINSDPGFAGAHPQQAVRRADCSTMSRLLDAANGLTRIVTIAPECDAGLAVTRMLSDQQIIVSAGHTDASLETLAAAIDSGLSMFTHVGNGCPITLGRHDNIIQRALSLSKNKQLFYSFIADGIHIPFFALRNYLRVVGIDRSIVISDAIAAAGLGAGTYSLGSRTVKVDDDGTTSFSEDKAQLAGSAITMAQSAAKLRQELGFGSAEITALTSGNARRLLSFTLGPQR